MDFLLRKLICYVSLAAIALLPTLTAAKSRVMRNETDHLALLEFRREVLDPRHELISWNDSLHFCFWSGVTCSYKHEQRVQALYLPSLGLKGRLTPHLGNLTFLKVIDLNNNSFHGEIPPQIGNLFRLEVLWLMNNSFRGVIPANISNCIRLKYMSLMFNKLNGGIPSELGFLPKLEIFRLYDNPLGGIIPPSLGNISTLARLSLGRCDLEGTIPHQLGQLHHLQLLVMDQNNLQGEVPLSIYNLSNLEMFDIQMNNLSGSLPLHPGIVFPNLGTLRVGGNRLTGLIPHWIFNSSYLGELSVNQNELVGTIPSDIGKLQRLSVLNIENNHFGGEGGRNLQFITYLANCSSLNVLAAGFNDLEAPFPESIANLSVESMEILTLNMNGVYGTIPPGIGKLVNLQWISLESNNLTGRIPSSIGKIKKLERLFLYDNRLTGQIPISLGNHTRLTLLDLSDNLLHGSMAPSLANCANLISLKLSYNKLTGTIPSSVAECVSLAEIFLNGNGLSGPIPRHLFGISSLLRLHLGSNSLSGSLPVEIGKLINANLMSIFDNQLSGRIPTELGQCIALEDLSMSGNAFEGEIPGSLGSLKMIRSLDFSRNKLVGKIPDSFTKLGILINLNLSYNDLEGEVPIEGHAFKNMSAISVEGNKKLCGGIRELHLPPCTKGVGHQHKSARIIKIILLGIVGGLVSITVLLLVILRSWVLRKKSLTIRLSDELNMKPISYRELAIATNGFSFSNLIGTGSFGTVYKGVLDNGHTDVAVKVLNLEQRGASKSFVAECEALRNIRHRNLVKILTCCSGIDSQRREFKALVFEFMPNGTLESWLHPPSELSGSRYLDLKARVDIAIDIAGALDYLHTYSPTTIVHCDLKPSNILLDVNMVAHVSDFGLSKILLTSDESFHSQQQSSANVLRGTIGYIPPEYGIGGEVTTAGDVFSYGIILLEMVTGKRPTHDMFKDGMSISNYAKMALTQSTMKIVDPRILPTTLGEDGMNKIHDCLVSAIKIGIACSSESPCERPDMKRATTELELVRKNLIMF